MTDDTTLSLFTIYDHPSDYPAHFVVREYQVARDGCVSPVEPPQLYPTLQAARQVQFDAWRMCLRRQAGDDPVIIESWL